MPPPYAVDFFQQKLWDWDPVDDRIDNYTPRRVDPATWSTIGEFVREVVRAAQPTSDSAASRMMWAVTGLTDWAVGVAGYRLDAHEVLDADVITQYLRSQAIARTRPGVAATLRSTLLKVARANLGRRTVPASLVTLHTSEVSVPYNTIEIAGLSEWARLQGIDSVGHSAQVMLATGLGAGLTPGELSRARGTDVFEVDGCVSIAVNGSRSRVVTVHRDWEQLLVALAARIRGRFLFRPERTSPNTKNTVNDFARTHRPTGLPALSQHRLRATWIVWHLEAGTPIHLLAAAAGVETLTSFERFLPHLRPVRPQLVAGLLRSVDPERHR